MRLLLALLGVLLGPHGAPALSFEASEEMDLGMASAVGEGGGVGCVDTSMGLLAKQSWRGSWSWPLRRWQRAGLEQRFIIWLPANIYLSLSTREDWACRVQGSKLGCRVGGEPLG